MLGIKKLILRTGARVAAPLLFKYFLNKRKQVWQGNIPVCLSFDCDMKDDYAKLPFLLEDLNSFRIKASFGIIGRWLECKPRIHEKILEEGHEIINHTYSHPNNELFHPGEYFNQLTPQQQENQINDFSRVCKKLLDYLPNGFRTPHFGDLHTPSVYEILERVGYSYSTSTVMTKTKAGGMPYYPNKRNFLVPGEYSYDSYKILELPVAACPEHFFPVLDSVHCVRQEHPAHPNEAFKSIFLKSIETGIKHGLPLVYDLGPQDVGGQSIFHETLEAITADTRLKVMPCNLLAKTWCKRFPPR